MSGRGEPSAATVAARVQSLLALRRVDQAGLVLGDGLANWPEDHNLLCLHGQIALMEGRAADALESVTVALRQMPDSEWAYQLLSVALLNLGRDSEAMQAALNAVRINPEEALAHRSVSAAASVRGGGGARRQALASARRAAELAPEDPASLVWMASLLYRYRRRVEAEQWYRSCLHIDPTYVPAHLGLARALGARRRQAEAASHYAAALQLDAENEEARRSLVVLSSRLAADPVRRVVDGVFSAEAAATLIRGRRLDPPAGGRPISPLPQLALVFEAILLGPLLVFWLLTALLGNALAFPALADAGLMVVTLIACFAGVMRSLALDRSFRLDPGDPMRLPTRGSPRSPEQMASIARAGRQLRRIGVVIVVLAALMAIALLIHVIVLENSARIQFDPLPSLSLPSGSPPP